MKRQLLNVYGVLVIAGFFLLIGSPASAQGNTQISGTGAFDGGANCGVPPAGFEDFFWFTVELEGDLVGCLYTLPEWSEVTNSRMMSQKGTLTGRGISSCNVLEST